MKELQDLESKWGKMREDLAHKLLEEQDTVFRQYYEAKWGNGDGGSGRASETYISIDAIHYLHILCDTYIH